VYILYLIPDHHSYFSSDACAASQLLEPRPMKVLIGVQRVGRRKTNRVDGVPFNRSLRSSPSSRARVPPYGALLQRVNIRQEATPRRISSLVLILGAGVIVWHWKEIKHLYISTIRSTRIGFAATLAVLDYRRTYSRIYASDEERLKAISECHSRAAGYTLKALLANGGVFIKLVCSSTRKMNG